MESSIMTQAADSLQKKKRRKVYIVVFLCLALVVVAVTVALLKMYGHAMNYRQKVLACPLEVHEHTQQCRNEEGELICGYADYVVHVHNADCYNAEGELVCKLPQIEEHKHDESCWVEEKVLTCGMEEEDGGHVHTEDCYTVEKVLVCGELELHTHDEDCYETDADGNKVLTCGKLELVEHVHGEECFEVQELTPEEVEAMNSQSSESSDAEASGNPGGASSGGSEDPESSAESEIPKGEFSQTYEDDSVVVEASYNADAKIPEDAKLQVYAVTVQSDPDRYEQRVDDALGAIGSDADDKDVSAKVLNIGFYLPDGTEVEPAAPVTITVQFMDGGVPAGAPVTVVHFGEDGTQTYSAGQDADGTTFRVDGFSDFAFVAEG